VLCPADSAGSLPIVAFEARCSSLHRQSVAERCLVGIIHRQKDALAEHHGKRGQPGLAQTLLTNQRGTHREAIPARFYAEVIHIAVYHRSTRPKNKRLGWAYHKPTLQIAFGDGQYLLENPATCIRHFRTRKIIFVQPDWLHPAGGGFPERGSAVTLYATRDYSCLFFTPLGRDSERRIIDFPTEQSILGC